MVISVMSTRGLNVCTVMLLSVMATPDMRSHMKGNVLVFRTRSLVVLFVLVTPRCPENPTKRRRRLPGFFKVL
jgi:hypothetical protein